ncbi:hypothetical protein GBZ86_16830, partial [Clostridium tarantellae]|nr:hypothetical protein [Clostridium tarantellae]
MERYGFITIKQASRIWFRTKKDSYNLAQRRLSACVKCDQLKVNIQRFKQDDCNIYYLKDDYSRVSRHTMKIMDIFIELQLMGAKVSYFKREENWLEGRYRSDAFAIINMEGYIIPLFIEVLD